MPGYLTSRVQWWKNFSMWLYLHKKPHSRARTLLVLDTLLYGKKLLKLCHGDCPSFMWPTWMLRPIRAPFQDLVLFSGFCTSLHFSFLCFFLLHQPAATLWLKSSVGPLYCPVCERHALLLISSSNLCTWNPCPPPTDIFCSLLPDPLGFHLMLVTVQWQYSACVRPF